MTKRKILLLCGGRSGEHEVSLASASSVLRALDRSRYQVALVFIDRSGRWLMSQSPDQLLRDDALLHLADGREPLIDPSRHDIVPLDLSGSPYLHEGSIDVIIPMLHGPLGEDGAMQGLFEIAGIPYVGAGVLASAVGMDKVVMKRVLEREGLTSVPYCLVLASRWANQRESTLEDIERKVRYPVFVKPCNMGSSVGISRAPDRTALQAAVDIAVRYDRRVIVEQAVDAREVECGVLGNDEPLTSVVGEIKPHREFYDYEAKYTEGLADLIIPADISPEQTRQVQDLARRAFVAVDAAGMARVDFFIRKDTGEVLVNEINTIPGFTATSMYPKLWEASGMTYSQLLDRLIDLAVQRHHQNSGRWFPA